MGRYIGELLELGVGPSQFIGPLYNFPLGFLLFRDIMDDSVQKWPALNMDNPGVHLHIPNHPVGQAMVEIEFPFVPGK